VTLESAQHSFPSGHTADLVTSMIFVALLWRRVPVAVAALAWALAVAGSRMALAQHYPTDVLAGAAIAAVVSLTIARAWVWPRLAPARVPAAGGPVL
jgi:undecaprenyl-diphosphatase